MAVSLLSRLRYCVASWSFSARVRSRSCSRRARRVLEEADESEPASEAASASSSGSASSVGSGAWEGSADGSAWVVEASVSPRIDAVCADTGSCGGASCDIGSWSSPCRSSTVIPCTSSPVSCTPFASSPSCARPFISGSSLAAGFSWADAAGADLFLFLPMSVDADGRRRGTGTVAGWMSRNSLCNMWMHAWLVRWIRALSRRAYASIIGVFWAFLR